MGLANTLQVIPAAQTVTTTTETGIATVSPAVTTGTGDIGVKISGDVIITPGAGTTAVQVRLHFGTLISNPAVDQTIQVPVTASVQTTIPYNFYDLTNATSQVGGSNYRLSVQQVGATGNGTVNGGHLSAEV